MAASSRASTVADAEEEKEVIAAAMNNIFIVKVKREAPKPEHKENPPEPFIQKELDERIKIFTRVEKEVKLNRKNLPMSFSPQVVYRGNVGARILVIGIAPGEEEIKQGLPFVGESGKLVESLLQDLMEKLPDSLRAPNEWNSEKVEDHFVFTNTVFGKANERRAPHAHEIAAYLPFLKRLIFAMKPRLIVCLGNVPSSIISFGCNLSAFLDVPEHYQFSEEDPPINNFIKVQSIQGRCGKVNIYNNGDVFTTHMVPMNHPVEYLYKREKGNERKRHWKEKLEKVFSTTFSDTNTRNLVSETPRCEPIHVSDIGGSGSYRSSTVVDDGVDENENESNASSEEFKGFLPESERYITDVGQMIDRLEQSEMFNCLLRKAPGSHHHIKQRFYHRKFCGMLRTVEYDRKENLLHSFLVTPDGENAVISLKGFRYEFHVLPHPCIAEGDAGSFLNQEYLDKVNKSLLKGLRYKMEKESVLTPRRYINNPDIILTFSDGKRMMEKYVRIPPTTICISVGHHDLISDLTEVIESQWKWYKKKNPGYCLKPKLMNNMFTAAHRFNYKTGIPQSTWMRFAPGSIEFDEPANAYGLQYKGLCDITYDVSNQMTGRSASGLIKIIEGLDFAKPTPIDETHYPGKLSDDHAPLTRVSMDIECANPDKKFPDATRDPVTTICNIVHFKNGQCSYNKGNHTLLRKDMETFYDKDDADYLNKAIELGDNLLKEPDVTEEQAKKIKEEIKEFKRDFYRNIAEGYYEVYFTLGLVDNTIKKENERKIFFEFASEDVMLYAWVIFILSLGPSYMCGHNIKKFDLMFIINRIRTLNLDINEMGLIEKAYLAVKQRRFESRAFGERIITQIQGMNGCVILDTLEMFFRESKKRSYTLNALADDELGEKKNDMPYPAIWGYFIGTEKDRRELTDYCARDARIVDQLINKGNWDSGLCEFARLNSAVTEFDLYTEGQQIVVLSSIMKQSFVEGERILIVSPRSKDVYEENILADEEERYWKKKDAKNIPEFDDVDLNDLTEILDEMNIVFNKNDEVPVSLDDFFSTDSQIPTHSKTDCDEEVSSTAASKLPQPKHPPKTKTNTTTSSKPVAVSVSDDPSDQDAIKPVKNAFSEMMNASRKRKRPASEPIPVSSKKKVESKAPAYQGATVLPPKTGCHIKPIATFDFAALYPSIMRRYNICLSTIMYESDFLDDRSITKDQCNKSPVKGKNPRNGKTENVYFIKHEFYEGIFRTTESSLKLARESTKKLQATYNLEIQVEDENGNKKWVPNPNYDPVKFAICGVRELKIKIIMNSMYGASGAGGVLSSKDCAAAVTAWGREAIMLVKEFLEKEYGATIYGGDTDSVFASFPGIDSVAQMEAAADAIADAINKHFQDPMKIEYEKCYYPMILIAPKRYFGLKYTRGRGVQIEFKGVETVRRDSLGYVKTMLINVIESILKVRGKEEGAKEYEARIRSYIDKGVQTIQMAGRKLLQGKVPTHMLVMSKQYSKHDYKAITQPHLFVRQKMIDRGLKAPELGERIPFIYVVLPHDPTTQKERKGCEMAEHPDYAIENNLRINYKLYFEKKFMKPVHGIMKHFLKDKAMKAIISKNTVQSFQKDKKGKMRMVSSIKKGFGGIESSMLENEVNKILFNPQNNNYLGVRDSDTVKLNSEYSGIGKFVNRTNVPRLSRMSKADKAATISTYKTHLQTALDQRDVSLKTCQDCTKTKHVICDATDCESYFPRIESAQKLRDIEDICKQMGILSV